KPAIANRYNRLWRCLAPKAFNSLANKNVKACSLSVLVLVIKNVNQTSNNYKNPLCWNKKPHST
ncbi:MAG: hypothetical protein P3M73_00285, partial [Candidatus Hodgkinia cicadicola]